MSSNPIKVVLVDDHQIFRDAVVSMFQGVDDVLLKGVANSAEQALPMIKLVQPDVLVLDVSLPAMNGIDFLKVLQKEEPGVAVLMLSMHVKEEYVFQAISKGAKGYLPKQDTNQQELFSAIRKLAQGKEYYHHSVEGMMQNYFIHQARQQDQPQEEAVQLTKRELQVLQLVVEGLTNHEIANKLFVNVRTVETHKTNILQKLSLKNTVQLVKYAIKNRLVEL